MPRTSVFFLRTARSAGLFVFAAALLLAQGKFGEITGAVFDPSGAAIPGATVSLLNQGEGRDYSVSTLQDGSFIARNLDPGRYTVVIAATGFAAYRIAGIDLPVGKTLRVNASLQVAQGQQTIEVPAGAQPLIDMQGATIARDVDAEEFDRLPKTRTFQSLALTLPSVNSGDLEGGLQVNGASGAENRFNIDGVPTNSAIDGRSRQNAIFEILSEVQVETAGIEAEYGGALGGVVNAVTKSGGNAFHGDLHVYFDGSALAAAPVPRLQLDPVTENSASYVQDSKNPARNYEAGGSLGGYLLRNRLYFFTAVSPRWSRQSKDYLFGSAAASGTLDNKTLTGQVFNKLSWDASRRVRANVNWLYSPMRSTGSLPPYNAGADGNTAEKSAAMLNQGVGFVMPQSNFTGDVTASVTDTTILSLRGGYFYDNYKDTGIPDQASVTYSTTAIGLPFVIPASLQQPAGAYNYRRLQNTFYDRTTRAFGQADVSKYARFLGSHDLKAGYGIERNIDSAESRYGAGGYVLLFWDKSFRGQRGRYGYYEVDDIGLTGSTGGDIHSIYVQDRWHVSRRLTLSLGLRTENELVPAFQKEIRDYAFKFGFGDKIAPRLGASLDVFGNGVWKLYGSWGRFFDNVKFDISRGSFGGNYWHTYYRALDTLDVWSLSKASAPGQNLWNTEYRDRRPTAFENVDPELKPMSTDRMSAGTEVRLGAYTVLGAHFVHDNLRRAIEDMGTLVNGNESYYFANPGENFGKTMMVTGRTAPFDAPKARRQYDALELTLSRRFARNWFGNASYVYSRLWGNYSGIGSSDELLTPTTGSSAVTAQQPTGSVARPGSNATSMWDLDEILWDSHGNLGNLGRLATDRPHALKLYGSYFLKTGTEIGGFFRAASGTPLSTYVTSMNQLTLFVNGRGDMGRTPMLSQTDLLVAHEFKFGESKRLRFEFDAQNVFNQKTSRHSFNFLNRGSGISPRASSLIDLSGADLAKGYDYNALILATADSQKAYDPRYGMADLFNPGFAGRLGVKFVF